MSAVGPNYDLRPASLDEIRVLVEQHHGYGSIGKSLTYGFGVWEGSRMVAAYAWQPPPPGAAKAVCPEEPAAVLALSRMVAVPREERALNHVSRPLRFQMKHLIDRGRWPVLLTYSDEGQGHTGHVYKCSGWQPTVRSKRPVYEDAEGRRVSSYQGGAHNTAGLTRKADTHIQRWEHRACPAGGAGAWLEEHGWFREPIPGKVWRSGRQAFRIVQRRV